jgi:hypothetical protein
VVGERTEGQVIAFHGELLLHATRSHWGMENKPHWVLHNLKTILAPTLCVPHTAQQFHEYLGYDGHLFGTQHVVEYYEETHSHAALTHDHSGAVGTWASSALPAPLSRELDESVVEGEYARLEG